MPGVAAASQIWGGLGSGGSGFGSGVGVGGAGSGGAGPGGRGSGTSGPPGAGGGEGVGGFTARMALPIEIAVGSCRRVGSIGELPESLPGGAMHAAEHAATSLHAVTDDGATTVITARGEQVNGALEGGKTCFSPDTVASIGLSCSLPQTSQTAMTASSRSFGRSATQSARRQTAWS
jgi:hypothetical protein